MATTASRPTIRRLAFRTDSSMAPKQSDFPSASFRMPTTSTCSMASIFRTSGKSTNNSRLPRASLGRRQRNHQQQYGQPARQSALSAEQRYRVSRRVCALFPDSRFRNDLAAEASSSSKGTSAAVSPGGLQPFPEKDYYWSAGVLHHFGEHLTVTENGYFRLSQDLIDLGQFGFVPIFVPFNYQHGRVWGSEFSATYNWGTAERARQFHLFRGAGQRGCQRPVQLHPARSGLHRQPLHLPRSQPAVYRLRRHHLQLAGLSFQRGPVPMAAACGRASPIRTNWERTSRSISPRKRAGRCLTSARSERESCSSTPPIISTSCAMAPESASSNRALVRAARCMAGSRYRCRQSEAPGKIHRTFVAS